jgi:hypothetical protein
VEKRILPLHIGENWQKEVHLHPYMPDERSTPVWKKSVERSTFSFNLSELVEIGTEIA